MPDVIRRLSLLNLAVGVLFNGAGVCSATQYMASLSLKQLVGTILPVLVVFAVAVGLLEMKASGLSWQQTQSLQRATRPLWAKVAGFAVLAAIGILLAPPVPKGIIPF